MSQFIHQFKPQEIELFKKAALARFAENRKKNNPFNSYKNKLDYNSPEFEAHIKNELTGILGEVAVASLFNLDLPTLVYDANIFTVIKNSIKDAGQLEVRSSHHARPALICHVKDQEKNDENTVFILVRINYEDNTAELLGYEILKNVLKPKNWCDNKKLMPYKAAYRITAENLKPITDLLEEAN